MLKIAVLLHITKCLRYTLPLRLVVIGIHFLLTQSAWILHSIVSSLLELVCLE